jgi:hypothetical protein
MQAMGSFTTELTVTGPWRSPIQMLQEQGGGKGATVHEGETAADLGLAGAPIEGCTHFSQFDPLAVALWGDAWFERGCISSHFRTMVVEGEDVQASLTVGSPTATSAAISAQKADGTPVLAGTASLGDGEGGLDAPSALDARLASMQGDPGELFVLDRLELGTVVEDDRPSSVDHPSRNGSSYPFSLDEKLAKITEPHPWYTAEGAASSPWGRAVLPFEMVSVLANKAAWGLPVRQPSLGLFLDLEIRLVHGPVFVGQDYLLRRELVGLSQSRRTESMWVRTTLTDAGTGEVAALVLLHSGVFKASYPDYPPDRLT